MSANLTLADMAAWHHAAAGSAGARGANWRNYLDTLPEAARHRRAQITAVIRAGDAEAALHATFARLARTAAETGDAQ